MLTPDELPYYTLSPTYSVCKNHGYIAGEVYECPQCHEETEVYSRITGYYRPVKNWNDGKSQEFKDRRLYDVATSKLTHVGPLAHQPKVVDVSAGAAVAAPTNSTLPAENAASITASS